MHRLLMIPSYDRVMMLSSMLLFTLVRTVCMTMYDTGRRDDATLGVMVAIHYAILQESSLTSTL
eukprot:9304-Eustigmatos_ZCMA.PRE.1